MLTFLFIGGSRNNQIHQVEDPTLVVKTHNEQYIRTDIDGEDVYQLVDLCYREARNIYRKNKKNTPQNMSTNTEHNAASDPAEGWISNIQPTTND